MRISFRTSGKIFLTVYWLLLSMISTVFSDDDLTVKQENEQAVKAEVEKKTALKKLAGPYEAALKRAADEALVRQIAAQNELRFAQNKSKQLSQSLWNLKLIVSKAHLDVRAAEEKMKLQAETLTKAAATKVTAEKAAAAAKKAADEVAKVARAAAVKAKAEAEKAAKAVKAAADTLETIHASIAATKQAEKKASADIKKADAEIAEVIPELKKAEDAFAAVTKEVITKQRALEDLLISAGRLVSFSKSIAPIFAMRCLVCHNARTAKGRYNMETYAAVMKGGESGEVVEAGDGKASNLYVFVEDGTMPKDADSLTTKQIATIKKWIDTGAKLDVGVAADARLFTIIPKLPQPKPPESYSVPMPVTAVAFSPDGKVLASSGYHEVMLWNPADGQLLRRITNVAERVNDVRFTADGKIIAVAAGTPAEIGEVKLFNVSDGKLLADLVRTDDSVYCLAFSADDKRLAAGGADRAIRVYEVSSGRQELLIEDHADWVMGIAWSPDGSKLASASRDKTSKIFDSNTGDSLMAFNSHEQPVFGVAFSPDGNQVITGGRDKKIRIWKVTDAKQTRAIEGFGNAILQILVTKDGQVFSCSADKNTRLHSIDDGKKIRTYSGHQDWVYSVAFNSATKKLATGSYDGEIRIWNSDNGEKIVTFTAAPGYKKPVVTAQEKEKQSPR